jgi:hypothetical protein
VTSNDRERHQRLRLADGVATLIGAMRLTPMIRIAISPAAYAVTAATLPASVGFEQNKAPNGDFYVWLEPKYVDRLRALRKPRESYSDVILRKAEASEGGE